MRGEVDVGGQYHRLVVAIDLPTIPANRDVTLVVESLFDDLVNGTLYEILAQGWSYGLGEAKPLNVRSA